MACSRCSVQALRAASRPAQFAQPARLTSLVASRTRMSMQARAQSTQAGPAKTGTESSGVAPSGAKQEFTLKGMTNHYALYGGTLHAYRSLSLPAAYSISEADRRNDTIERLEDGEEVGESEGPWHKLLDLPPTFSTWSQVTMLRMYLIVARARNLEPEAYKSFHHQLLDHFFFDCERLMDSNHDISAKSLRQRHLKDVFVQWRGLMAAYDEGLAKGDAVLASAVWRNLYKARPGVDFAKVAAVVSYIRASLWDLERMGDLDFVTGHDLLRKTMEGQMRGVEMQIAAVSKCP